MCSLITPIDFPDLLLQGSSQVERKKKREGFAAGAPIDTADEGLHCTAKPPPSNQLHDYHQLRSSSKSLSANVIHLLSM